MKDDDKKQLVDSLKEMSQDDLKSPFDGKPDVERELLIGQLRNIKALIKKIDRKKLTGNALNAKLDEYNEMRNKYLNEIKDSGFTYTEGDEDSDDYKQYEF